MKPGNRQTYVTFEMVPNPARRLCALGDERDKFANFASLSIQRGFLRFSNLHKSI